MTKEELEKASIEDLLDSLDYCGYDSYYASYREIIIIEIRNRLEENERLKQQIEKMKCCENCKYHAFWGNELKCTSLSHDEQSECDKSKHKWELAE